MLRRGFIVLVVVPLITLEAYLLCLPYVVGDRDGWLHGVLFSEQGVAEIGTAICFLAAACVALSLVRKSRGRLAPHHRAFFLAFALGGVFVTMEETSYGQHFISFQCPQWFLEHSAKPEINLHNLYGNKLSNVLREVANLAFPIGCVILPLLMRFSDRAYRRGHWSYFLLPRMELITLVLIGQGLTAVENVSKWTLRGGLLVRPGEVQEFYWAAAALVYACVMHRRLLNDSSEPVILKMPHATERDEIRMAA